MSKAGFRDIRVEPLADGMSMVVACFCTSRLFRHGIHACFNHGPCQQNAEHPPKHERRPASAGLLFCKRARSRKKLPRLGFGCPGQGKAGFSEG
jgi:hypothetical protein